MIEEVREMLNEKASLEREYLELVHISDEMNLSAEIHDKMMMANIAHSLSVIADALADRKTEPQNECADCECTNDCSECKKAEHGCKDEPQTEEWYTYQDEQEYNDRWQTDEPQYEMGMGTLKCDNCSEYGSFKCAECDGEMYFKRLEPKDEPQTEYPRCVINGTPFDECGFCEHFNCDTCKCEAQTERSSE